MMKHNELTYLVSSHVSFEKICLPRLLDSLKDQKVIVTVGGSDQTKIIKNGKNEFHYVEHNSFDYSSLINLVENDITTADYVFLLHDTMECGPNFRKLSMRYKKSNICLCNKIGICNLGTYKTSYLRSIKNEIIALKNCSKLLAIQKEGKLGNFDLYDNSEITVLNKNDFYQTGTQRTKVYFKAVDLWKYGANNGETFKAGKLITCP